MPALTRRLNTGQLRSLLLAGMVSLVTACDPISGPATSHGGINGLSFDLVDCGAPDPKDCQKLQSAIDRLRNHSDMWCSNLGASAHVRFNSVNFGYRPRENDPGYTNDMWSYDNDMNVYYRPDYFDNWTSTRVQTTAGLLAHEELHFLYGDRSHTDWEMFQKAEAQCQ